MLNVSRAISICFVLCLVQPALADPVKDAYDRAMVQFNNKEYAKARSEFLAAYDLRPDPVFLFSVGQTYRYERNLTQALEYYRRYLREAQPSDDLRGEAQAHITQLENELQRIEAEKRKAFEDPPKNTDRVEAPISVAPTPTAQPPSTDTDRKRHIPLGSKIAGGVTGAGLISALVFTKLGLDAEKDLKKNSMATQSDADRVERYQNLINVSWAVTGVAAATAVVIYFVAPSYTTDRKTVGAASLPGGGWTATFTGSF